MNKFLGASLLSSTAILAATGALLTPQDARADVCYVLENPSYVATPVFSEVSNPNDPTSLACGRNANAGTPGATNATAVGANTAAVQDGTALGFGAQANAANSVALGSGSIANIIGTVSVGTVGGERRIVNLAPGILGTDAVNFNQLGAVATTANTALTNAATALTTANTAITNAASAQSTANTALAKTQYLAVGGSGTGPSATGTGAVALGIGQTANGNGAVAIGDPNTATGTGAVAIGADNTASGNGAVAIGNANTANGNGAVAIGNGANASHTNAVAVGSGAGTSRANQVKLGGTGSSVTVGDIAASTAAQSGLTDVATVDGSGTIGRDTTIRPAIASLQTTVASQATTISAIQTLDAQQTSRLTTLEAGQVSLSGRIDSLNGKVDSNYRSNNGGIAAAMAMGGTVMPADAKFAMSFNLSTYRGEQGFSASAVVRASNHIYFQGGFAGSSVKGSTGGRVGMTFAW